MRAVSAKALYVLLLSTLLRFQRDKRKSWVKWQPAFRLVKFVFVVVNRQHRVHNQTVVPVVSVVVKREGDSLKGYTKRSGRNRGRSPRIVVRIQLPGRQYLVTLLPCYISADGEVLSYRQLPLFLYPWDCVPGYDRFA